MLNFAVKLISDAGFQHEISNVTTAAQQLDIFSRVLCTAIEGVIDQHRRGEATDQYERSFDELVRVACHSEHVRLFVYRYTGCT
jgi:negative elongation factor C/D